MMRKLLIVWLSVCSFACFSEMTATCPMATPNIQPGFCTSFKAAAQCRCMSALPQGMCLNMKSLYDRMLALYGSVRRACESQHDTSVQNCLDAWNCYRVGGMTSTHELCSGTGSPCE